MRRIYSWRERDTECAEERPRLNADGAQEVWHDLRGTQQRPWLDASAIPTPLIPLSRKRSQENKQPPFLPYYHLPPTLLFHHTVMKFLSTFVLLAALSVFAEAGLLHHDHVHRSNHNGISRRASGNNRRCKDRPVRIS